VSDTNNLSTLPSAASHAAHIGQATSVEQARAAAEVQALVIVAQNRPRVTAVAVQEMEITCRQKAFADRAFYDYSRGGKRIYDINVDTARDLARCWGNVQYGTTELRQDRDRHESELMAWAWDMQANLRVERKIIVPHVRNTNDGDVILTDVRDVYELLANNISRRLRECIKDVLPLWFVEEAKARLWQTLKDGGGEPLPKRIAKAVKEFGTNYGVRLEQLERRLEAKSNEWTELDLAKLTVTFNTLRQGGRVADEFPPERVDPADLEHTTVVDPPPAQQPDPAPAAGGPEPVAGTPPTPAPDAVGQHEAETGDEPDEQQPTSYAAGMAQRGHVQTIHHLLRKLEYPSGDEGMAQKLEDVSTLIGRTITKTTELTAPEANRLITDLNMILEYDQPNHALDALLDARRMEQQQ
jgi:hypothetical protein